MKHILIPTDFSKNSWNAIAYILQYYKTQVCKFYLLHTHPLKPSTIENMPTLTLKSIIEQSSIQLQDFKEQILKNYSNKLHSFETLNEFLSLPKAIKSCLKKYPIHKIIMGTKQTCKHKPNLFGTTTKYIMDAITNSPIFIIPDNYNHQPIKEVLFPTDLNRFYSENEINLIKQITIEHNATLRVLNIKGNKSLNKIQKYNLSVLKQGFNSIETHYHSINNYNKKETIINECIEKLSIDLLIMVNYKHNIVKRIIHEPVIKKIGIKPHIPFLIIPEIMKINTNPKTPIHHENTTHNNTMV